MPIQPMSFPILSFDQSNPSLAGLLKGQQAYQGMVQNQYLGPSLAADLQKQQLANSLAKGQLPYQLQAAQYLPQQAQANVGHTQAETSELINGRTPEEQAHALYFKNRADPFNDIAAMPELTKASMMADHFSKIYGPDDPRTLTAIQNYQVMLKQSQAMSGWRQAMSDTADYRFLPPNAKEMLNSEQAAAGINPSARNTPAGLPINPNQSSIANPQQPQINNLSSALQQANSLQQGNQPLNLQQVLSTQGQRPQQSPNYNQVFTPQQMSGLLQSGAIKGSTTAQQYNRNVYGANADQTLNNMLKDQGSMEYYTGLTGRTQLALDKAKGSTQSSPEYQAYQRYLANSQLLANQLRQFYGDSIQPSAVEKLNDLAKPSGWTKDPEAARQALNAFVTTFKQERQIGQNAMFNPMQVFGNSLASQQQPKNTNPIQSYTQEDLEHTAQKYKMSVEQVKQKLGVR
jgi:hypothetical protein